MMHNSEHELARLFVAIELPDEIHTAAEQLQQQLRALKLCEGTYTRSQALHITLKFFGFVPRETIAQIQALLQSIQWQPLHARLGSVDFFGHEQFIKIIYLHVVCPALAQLVHDINMVTAAMVPAEQRPYIGHITLLRVKRVFDGAALHAAINDLRVEPLSFVINRFLLKESIRLPDGNREYKVIGEYFSR